MNTHPSCITLPVIDFSRLNQQNPGTPSWESVKAQVKSAMEDFGCFQAQFRRNSGDSETAIDFGALDELYDLPIEKKRSKESDEPLHSYFADLPHGPLFEGFTIYDPTSLKNIENFSLLMWPEGNPYFSGTLHSFSQRVLELHNTLKTMILESLGVEKYKEELESMTSYTIGIQKYEESKSGESKLGLNSHKDSNLMTIIYQNDVGGLEIESQDGNWFLAKPPGDSFIVFAGECLHAWCNGRFYVPFHRVKMSGSKRRYTVGLFSVLKKGYTVKAPDELVDEEHPLLYKPFDYSEFRKFRQANSKTEILMDLKSYCAI